MAKAAKFLFDHDFRKPPQSETKDTAAIEHAEARGYMRGLADGQRQADVESQLRLAQAIEHLAQIAGTVLAQMDEHRSETEALAIDFALTLGRKLAGDSLAREPLAGIAQAAAQAFQHLRGVPHLVVRTNDALVEPVDSLIQRMARERGFDGRIVTVGEPEIAFGDVRLEWADGGVVRDQTLIEQAVAQALGASDCHPGAPKASPGPITTAGDR